MEEKIRDGIAQALLEKFGEGYHIYSESMEQGSEKPCFFILHKSTKIEYRPMKRCIAEYEFEVRMIIGNSLNSGIYSYAEDIFEALKCIRCGEDRINAVRNEFKIEKGIGKVTADYLISGRIVEEECQLMEKLDIKEGE